MFLPLHHILEANGIRTMIIHSPDAHEFHKPPFGIAVCAVGGLSQEHTDLLHAVGLGGWYSTYSFTQGEERYQGYVVSYSVNPWKTEASAREFLEQALEVQDE